MHNLLADFRFAMRTLLKAPGFAVVAIVTLALGIGVNTAVFSLTNTMVFAPLPYDGAEQLATLHRRNSEHPTEFQAFSYLDYTEYRDRNDVFESLGGSSHIPLSVGRGDSADMHIAQIVTGNFFDVFNVQPVLGRLISEDDDRNPGEHPVVVLSHDYWRTAFAGAPDVVGSNLIINGHDFTIIGVAPMGFFGTWTIVNSDLYVPMMMQMQVSSMVGALSTRDMGWFDSVVGRLPVGMTIEQAEARINVTAAGMADVDPLYEHEMALLSRPSGFPTEPERVGAMQMIAMVIVGMVGLVLLVACANVANLLLARCVARRKEFGIRFALGSSRMRILQQLLIEAMLLAGTGGLAGLILASWLVNAFDAAMPQLPFNVSLDLDFVLDQRVLMYTLLATLLTGIVFGLAPALQAARTDLIPALKNDDQGGMFRGAWLRNVLVVSQVAVSLVLLIGAGLFLRSLGSARAFDPGFTHDGVLAVAIDLGMLQYDEAKGRDFHESLLRQAQSIPGVEAASLISNVPLGFSRSRDIFWIEGEPSFDPEDAAGHRVSWTATVPGLLDTLDIPLLRGRDFDDHDHANTLPVVIVNAVFAEKHWPGEDPLGKRLSLDSESGPFAEVIGVAKTVKYRRLSEVPTPFLYLPLAQRYSPTFTLLARTGGDPMTVLPAVREMLRGIDPEFVPTETRTLTSAIGMSLLPARIAAGLFTVFGALALALTTIGLYGVMSFMVSQRTREIGIRLAVGAKPRDVRRLVLRRAVRLAVIGIVIGLPLAFGTGQLLQGFLYDVSSTDPLTFGGVTFLLMSVALLATYVPARKAMKVDPMVALRHE
ncbi:MAG: ABC transporter permease [Planctomycetota bacterium]|nr:ABC transporter permease [Planctomycetota bacterium]